jgi:beta-glucanase (GH16 family)
VSAIFTYTDPLDGNPHFENDIEFPSRTFSRRAIWLNNYGPLQPPDEGTPQFLPIGFDAAREFAEYTIEVYEHATVWKINGKTISRFTHAEKAEPQRVVMNTWFRRRAWPRAYEGKSPYTNAGTDFMIDWVEVSSLDKTAPEPQ